MFLGNSPICFRCIWVFRRTNFYYVIYYFIDLSKKNGPLDGVRVLDLTRILAGPFCTMVLGDLGAEIIKIENTDGGDESRNWGPPFIGSESCYFVSINRNKKSVSINLKTKEGQLLCQQMAKKCDVLIENFVPGKLDEFGLGYNTLKSIAPHLIYCSITGYGSEGPDAHRPGFDVVAASVGGLLNITGPKDGEPSKVGVAMTDLATGLYAHGAIMAALLQRQKSNCGQKIDCDLLSTQVALLVNIGSNYLNANQESERWGSQHQSIVPYQAFKTSDGYFTASGNSNQQFAKLCKVLELEYLIDDIRFKNNEKRVINRVELLEILNRRFSEKTNAGWLKSFENSGIPYGPVNNMQQTFSDPQVQYSGIVQKIEHPTAGTIKVTGNLTLYSLYISIESEGPAVKYSNAVNAIQSPPPLLGQHTRSILVDDLKLLNESQLQKYANEKILLVNDEFCTLLIITNVINQPCKKERLIRGQVKKYETWFETWFETKD
ncbi:Succinate--hydroxymethylglutarate CoA-transferase [Nymphon striatum]|nr:Succinate--hydroxymethylglutarate CoA-transferase [Nymphon striatum]